MCSVRAVYMQCGLNVGCIGFAVWAAITLLQAWSVVALQAYSSVIATPTAELIQPIFSLHCTYSYRTLQVYSSSIWVSHDNLKATMPEGAVTLRPFIFKIKGHNSILSYILIRMIEWSLFQ